MKYTFCVLLILAGCQSTPQICQFKDVTVVTDTGVNFSDLDLASASNRKRAEIVLGIWRRLCPETRSSAVPSSRYKNYSCIFPGRQPERIIIGAHYDKFGTGMGVADNWSGITIVSSLMRFFTDHQPEYTLEFVAFAEEEPGMLGSLAYVNKFVRRSDGELVLAMINVDTLGLKPVVIDKRSTPWLACLASDTGQALNIEYSQSRWDKLAGDWEPFARSGTPVLNLHSVDTRTIRRIHSRKDTQANVDIRLLEEAYHLVLNVILNMSLSAGQARQK
jgi:hypothetical protein